MTFDIHQLNPLQNDYDALMEQFYGYIEELIEEFARSPEVEQLRSAQPEWAEYIGSWVQPLLEMGYNYEQVLLPQMAVRHVDRLVKELFPRKISLMSPEEAEGAIPELIAFWQFLQRVYQLPQAKKIIKLLQQIQPQFPALMADESNFGIAKAFFTSGQAMGFDMTTQEGLQRFQSVYNQSRPATPKSPQGFRELLSGVQADSTQAQTQSSPSAKTSKSSKTKKAKGFAKLTTVEPTLSSIDDKEDEDIPIEPDFFKTLQREMMQKHIDTLPPLSAAQIELLQQQQIEPTIAGTIVADFQRFVDFIGENEVLVGPKNHLISSIDTLAAINQVLTEPMQIALKRPQQKSYAVIHGLYLLLRCMGLGKIATKGKKPVLVLDPTKQQHWSQLNPTEQYFTLLEVWLVRAHDEILGERSGPFNCGTRVTQSWPTLPQKGAKMLKYGDQEHLQYYPGLMNLALMQLFGLVKIVSLPPEAGKGWRFQSVQPLPWGDVIVQLMVQGYWEQGMSWPSEADPTLPFGELQPLFQPYFPEWQQNLPGLVSEVRSGKFTFKVSLGKIWRRFVVSGTMLLEDLANMILDSVNFDRDHLDMFVYKDSIGREREIMHPYGDGERYTSEVTVGELPIAVGGTMTYIFDFGDWWKFQVLLESFEPMDLGTEIYGAMLESHGKAPQQYSSWDEDL